MATGDVTISIAVEGGVTKSVVLTSATRVLALADATAADALIDTDAEWQAVMVNKLGNVVLATANSQAQAAASWTPKTFTAAT
jgi:type IV secretory pathway TrbD component